MSNISVSLYLLFRLCFFEGNARGSEPRLDVSECRTGGEFLLEFLHHITIVVGTKGSHDCIGINLTDVMMVSKDGIVLYGFFGELKDTAVGRCNDMVHCIVS